MVESSKIKGGYYIKARCIQDSEIAHAPPHVREIWDWLIKEANHKAHKIHGTTIERGQCFTSYAEIQDGLSWMVGWRKCKYSKAACETTMKHLKKRGMITTRKTTRGMIITICNYEHYQDPENYETYRRTTRKPTGEPQTDDTIYKNDNKKEDKEDPGKKHPDKFKESKHYSSKIDKKILMRIDTAGRQIEKLFNVNPFAFIQECANKNYHPVAIAETLEYIIENRNDVRSFWPYARTTAASKSKNYYGRQAEAEAQEFKNIVLTDELKTLIDGMFPIKTVNESDDD